MSTYYELHKEQMRTNQKKWDAAHKDVKKKHYQKYYYSHLEQERARGREKYWRKKNAGL